MFTLYTTTACHLCEQAQDIIRAAAPSLTLHLQDIAKSEALVEKYGIKIPVLKHNTSEQELNWPFDSERLQQWLAQLEMPD